MALFVNTNDPAALPGPLPFRIRLTGGVTRTDPESFTPEEIEAAGYVPAPEKPAPADGCVVVWRDGAWAQESAPAPSLRPLSRFEFMSLLTGAERVALRVRAAAGDHVLADALEMLGLAAHVDLEHPMIDAMLGYVVSINLMSAARSAEIKSAALSIARS